MKIKLLILMLFGAFMFSNAGAWPTGDPKIDEAQARINASYEREWRPDYSMEDAARRTREAERQVSEVEYRGRNDWITSTGCDKYSAVCRNRWQH